MPGQAFEIRPAEPSHGRYSEIMTACFGQAPDDRYFVWKYNANPAGQVVGFEALADGQIAGFYGVIPWQLALDGQTVSVFQSMDTMTHPNFQRRGLFVTLAKACYAELAARHKDYVIIGIPGTSSFPGFVQKLGWSHVQDLSYVFKHHSWHRVRTAKALRVRPLEELDESFRAYLRERRQENGRLSVSMDAHFLDWRVFKNQVTPYKTLLVEAGSKAVGVAVANKADKGRVFLDLIDCVSPELWRDALNAVCTHLFEEHAASFVYTWRPGDPKRSQAFSREFFFRNPFKKGPFSYRTPFIVRSDASTLVGKALADPASFDLQPLIQD